MSSRNILRKIFALEIEEKILNTAAVFAFVCVFFPWVGGEWLGGKTVTFNGLGFFTSFIGLTVLLLQTYILLITIIPITGGPLIIKTRYKNMARLMAAALSTLLTVAIWSVLTKFTFEFSRLEIYFGLYGTLVGSLVTTLYSFLRMQEERKTEAKNLFTHESTMPSEQNFAPPPEQPEDHRYR